ncbi:nuclease-related domain-containing protein [Chloroflexota bacterium]
MDLEIEIIQLKRFRNLAILCIILAVATNEISHVYRLLPPQPLIAGILVLVLGIYFLYTDSRLKAEAERKRKGSEGEKSVGEILDRLKKPGVRVFHDLAFDYNMGNIDHVILSRQGIFVIETKYVSKRGNQSISSDGKAVFGYSKNPDSAAIKQAVRNARDLQIYLKNKTETQFPVKPIVVYPGWLVKPYYGDIWVLNPKYINWAINREPEIISETDYAVAESWISDLAKSYSS